MIDKILSQLDKVQNRGKQRWMACCPAHEDRTPSLAIQKLTDGRILMKCFAGCDVTDVLGSIGLTVSDLFPGSLGEFRGWEQLQREAEQKRNKPLEKERMIMDIAESDRKSGKRLSEQDLERERQAYMRIKNANHT